MNLELGERVMFNRKDCPVLTATFCRKMEMLRTAIEVWTGKRTSFVQMDFNTGVGKVRLGNEEKDLTFTVDGLDHLVHFNFGDDWCVGLFEEDYKVYVASEHKPHERETLIGLWKMRWVGYSATDRREEPLLLDEFCYCAQAKGYTVEQALS